VVERFVAVTGSDPRISVFFTNADVPRLKTMMVQHICELTGGPCKYTGKSMKESHTGMKVKEEHFTAFMDDLAKTLDELEVPAREKGEVLAAFNSLKADVVEP
jgi:hemoglobin